MNLLQNFEFAVSSLTNNFCTCLFSERELTFAICYRPSVCRLSSVVYLSVGLSVCRLSVTLVCPTQTVEIFGNISTALGTLVMTSTENFTEIVPGEPLRRGGGVKHMTGSQV